MSTFNGWSSIMRIQYGQLAQQGKYNYQQRDTREESLLAWVGQRPSNQQTEGGRQPLISDAARRLWFASLPNPVVQHPEPPYPANTPHSPAKDAAATCATEDEATRENDPKLSLVRRMIEMLTGEKIKVFDLQAFQSEQQSVELNTAELHAQKSQGDGEQQVNQPAGYGIEYDFHSVHEESEQSYFSAQGRVVTADGQTFDFSLDLQMTRSFREETTLSYREGDAIRKDPLVINFGGTAAQLASATNQRFRFDLDRDGQDESLPVFASGSAYLAIDLNGSGTVDDAKELFGPETGNGFAELARLDDDGNGWIDEGDGAFKQLQVWTPEAGTTPGKLRALADLDIGAISLTHTQTPFSLRGSGNEDLGVVRDTGVYLSNSGKAGSVQEIDVTV